MNHVIKSPLKNKPDTHITDNSIIIGNDTYLAQDITDIKMTPLPVGPNIVANFIHKGKKVSFAYAKTDEVIVQKAIQQLQSGGQPQVFELNTAELMFEFCLVNKFTRILSKREELKNFTLIQSLLHDGENVRLAFLGYHNDDNPEVESKEYYAYVMTDKRFIAAQQNGMSQNLITTLDNERITGINITASGLRSIISINTYREKLNIGVNRSHSQKVYYVLQKNLENYQNIKDAQTPQVQTNQLDPYEELKKVKELLDMGIITPEDFEAKKKQLLGL